MDSLNRNIRSDERPYSLQNRFYPLSSLNNELERLFGKPVYQENKQERVNTTANVPAHVPHYGSVPQQCYQQVYNASSYQNQPSPSSSACGHCGAAQFPNSAGASPFVLSSSPAASSDSGYFNQGQVPVAHHGSPAQHQPTHGSFVAHTHRIRPQKLKARICSFCFKNGERRCIFGSHELKNEQGIILCPILRRYVCNICGATGDEAHTRKYCPYNTEVNEERPMFRRYFSP